MVRTKEEKAAFMREYRKTHRPNQELHRIRSKRYYDKHLRKNPIGIYQSIPRTPKPPKTPKIKTEQIPTILLKKVVLTFYGGGKLACIKCGEADIDCLSLDHVNNDAHHRTSNHHVGGHALYRSLINRSYPKGYQTLCMNCNFKKSLEHLRKNGRSKNIVKDEILPLFKYFEDVALKAKDVFNDANLMDDMDVITQETRGLTLDDSPKTSIVFNLSADDVMTSFEVTRY